MIARFDFLKVVKVGPQLLSISVMDKRIANYFQYTRKHQDNQRNEICSPSIITL